MSKMSFSSVLLSAKQSVRHERQRVQRLQGLQVQLQALFGRFKPITKKAAWSNLYAWDHNAVTLQLSFEVDSLREGLSAQVLEFVEAFGDFEATDSRDHADKWSASRTFEYRCENFLGVRVDLELRMKVAEGSESCQKVQVGTEWREEPVYEIQCG